MLVNDVINPYHEWVMVDKVLENFVVTKYPDKYLVLADAHFNSASKLFLPNEIITGGTSSATGTVVNFDTTNNQIVYKSVSGTFVDTETITGGTSTITGTINGTPGLEVDAIHHWEIQRSLADGTTERLVVAKGETRNLPNPINNNTIETYTAVKVSNYEYEANRNDENRNVKLLDASYLREFERDFKEKIKI